MSAFTESTSSRNWWSLSSKSEMKEFRSVHLPRDKPNAFNTLVSAIGLKPKKQPPSLTIQSPPRNVLPVPRPNVVVQPRYTNRPPSKSVSSTIRSSDEPIEAKTPEDPNVHAMHYRQSLLTLSDIDPFAAGGTSPHNDPNRLSAYSNSSAPDSLRKKFDASTNRSSYGSSSSSSQRGHLPVSPVDSFKGSSRSRQNSLNHAHQREVWERPSSHATDVTRFSQPPPPTSASRPKMRARGMTDVGIGQSIQQFLRDESPPRPKKTSVKGSSFPPRVVVRQASMSRIGQPPSAPPVHDLPLPPSIDEGNLNDEHMAGSASSSSLALHKDPLTSQSFNPRLKEKKARHDQRSKTPASSIPREDLPRVLPLNLPNKSKTPQSPPPTHRTLKKSASHQSLRKRSSASSIIPFTETALPSADKYPKKQRSFHHPKLPLPPLPTSVPVPSLRHANSFTPMSNASPVTEQRRGSASSAPLIRKRLFSGSNSRRPSTSQSVLSLEDDVRSVFSLPGEIEHSTGAFITQPSFWDEMQPEPPSSAVMTEYTPQQIMSPAEMLKIEESVRDGAEYVRPRADSVASAWTAPVHGTELPSTPPISFGQRPSVPYRNNSLMSKRSGSPPSSRSSSPPLYTSLSPPPRPRARQANDHVSIRGRVAPAAIIPHPVLKAQLSRDQINRQSLLRKPSFLDIDFETDGDAVTNDSFLDLNRSSFDTVRSFGE